MAIGVVGKYFNLSQPKSAVCSIFASLLSFTNLFLISSSLAAQPQLTWISVFLKISQFSKLEIRENRMSKAEEAKLHIKVVINKEKTKVLFAEAGSDFTDVLLSFLLLPLGTIVDVLQKHYGDKAPVLGSLNSLYNGAANLDIIHFQDESYKIQLLTPQEFQTQLCKLRINASRAQSTSSSHGESYDGVFTDCSASFIIKDDLRVFPNVASSIIDTLNALDIDVTDMEGAETRNVTFGFDEF